MIGTQHISIPFIHFIASKKCNCVITLSCISTQAARKICIKVFTLPLIIQLSLRNVGEMHHTVVFSLSSFFLARKPPMVEPCPIQGFRVTDSINRGSGKLLFERPRLFSSISGISVSLRPFCLAFQLSCLYLSLSSSQRFLSAALLSAFSRASLRRFQIICWLRVSQKSFSLRLSGIRLSLSLALRISRFFMRSMSQNALATSSGGVDLASNSALYFTISCEFSASSFLQRLICSNSFQSARNRSAQRRSRFYALMFQLSLQLSSLHSLLNLRLSLVSLSHQSFRRLTYSRKPSTALFLDRTSTYSVLTCCFNLSLVSFASFNSPISVSHCCFSLGGRWVRAGKVGGGVRVCGVQRSLMARISFLPARFWQLGQLPRYSKCWQMQPRWKTCPQSRQERSSKSS